MNFFKKILGLILLGILTVYLMVTLKNVWSIIIFFIFLFFLILFVVSTMTSSFGIAKPHKRYKHKFLKKHIIDKDFSEIYSQIQAEYTNNLEVKRKQLLIIILICLTLLIISIILFLLIKIKLNINGKFEEKVLMTIFLPAFLFYIYFYKKYNKEYIDTFKEKIIRNMVNYLEPNLEYYPEGYDNFEYIYEKANFDNKFFNKFNCDDYIEGYSNKGIYVQLANIGLEKVNDRGEFLEMVYDGILSYTKIDKNIPIELKIKNNKIFFNKNENKVEMDSKEFENFFDIYCESKIIAMQILTHDVMEELINFYKNYKISFEIIIKNQEIYIRFDTGIMFEPNILKSLTDKKMLWIYYNILQFIISLTVKVNKTLKDIEI